MISGLKLIKETSWNEVFSVWQNNEGADPIWQEFAKREKGWDSWAEWRNYQSAQIGAAERQWKLYEIERPNELVPQFLMGPFKGWQKHYPGEENKHSFADLVSDKREWVEANTGVKERKNSFPQGTQFIGIYLKDQEKMVIYEGHHRCAAIAWAVAEGNPLEFEQNPMIAVTEMGEDEVALLRRSLNESSENPNK